MTFGAAGKKDIKFGRGHGATSVYAGPVFDSNLGKIALGFVVLGVVLLLVGGSMYYQEVGAEAEPTAVRAEQLLAGDLPANRHLRVEGATAALDDMARLPMGGGRNGRRWTGLAVPLVLPVERAQGRPRLVAVAWLNEDKFAEFQTALASGGVTGVSLRRFLPPRSSVIDALASRYPRLTLEAAPILSVDRRVEGTEFGRRIALFASLLSGLGAAGLACSRR